MALFVFRPSSDQSNSNNSNNNNNKKKDTHHNKEKKREGMVFFLFSCFHCLSLNENKTDTFVDNPQCFQACYNMFNVKLSMHASKSKERRGERKGERKSENTVNERKRIAQKRTVASTMRTATNPTLTLLAPQKIKSSEGSSAILLSNL